MTNSTPTDTFLQRLGRPTSQDSPPPWTGKDRFLAEPTGWLHHRYTGHSETTNSKVCNTVPHGKANGAKLRTFVLRFSLTLYNVGTLVSVDTRQVEVLTLDSRFIAMLIDGDNAQPSLMEYALAETAKYGIVTTRRIYGDWTAPQMSGWKDSLHVYAIQPVQQFRYTVGKNATDSALIIDAMDLLHTGTVKGFCIVSSDSDYTRLATRVREQGLFVMGIGRSTTPRSFVNACEVFVYTENLLPPTDGETQAERAEVTNWTQTVARAIELSIQEDGWAYLGTVGNRVRQLDPGFDVRTYGEKQLASLVRSEPELFDTRETKPRGGATLVYVKLKSQ